MHDLELMKTIKKIKKGKVNHFEEIIDAYGKKVNGYIYNLTKDKHLTEDLMQETFIKIYRNLDNYDQDKNFSVWIIAIARNTVYDYFKKKRINTFSLIDEKDLSEKDLKNDPSIVLEEKERLKNIDELIQKLPKKYRDLIILKYFEGLKYDEISKTLDLEPSKVKWQLYQARKLLMNSLNEKEECLWNAK